MAKDTETGTATAVLDGWEEAGLGTAYAKIGAYGSAGSGKTTTASLLAIGLAKHIGAKNAYMIDSETGSDFVAGLFRDHGMKLQVRKTRAFADFASILKQLGDSGEILIVDSISHAWQELLESYKTRTKKKRLAFQDWGVLKPTWQQGWSEPFVCSKLHIIVLGRLQFEYDYFQDESGAMELLKTGTKMRAETEFGYEPSLTFEMERVKAEEVELALRNQSKSQRQVMAQKLLDSSNFVHRATVLKDRSRSINGKKFIFSAPPDVEAVWESFWPFIESLTLGGEHNALDREANSQNLFVRDTGEADWQRKLTDRKIALEKVQDTIVRFLPGHTPAMKNAKSDVLERAFGTRSWTEIENRTPIEKLRSIVEPTEAGEKPTLEVLCMNKKDELEAEQR